MSLPLPLSLSLFLSPSLSLSLSLSFSLSLSLSLFLFRANRLQQLHLPPLFPELFWASASHSSTLTHIETHLPPLSLRCRHTDTAHWFSCAIQSIISDNSLCRNTISVPDFFYFFPDSDETFSCILGGYFSPVGRQEVTWIGKIMMIHLLAVVSEIVWAQFRAVVKTHYFNCTLMWCFTE